MSLEKYNSKDIPYAKMASSMIIPWASSDLHFGHWREIGTSSWLTLHACTPPSSVTMSPIIFGHRGIGFKKFAVDLRSYMHRSHDSTWQRAAKKDICIWTEHYGGGAGTLWTRSEEPLCSSRAECVCDHSCFGQVHICTLYKLRSVYAPSTNFDQYM